jgi:hypothetical protein
MAKVMMSSRKNIEKLTQIKSNIRSFNDEFRENFNRFNDSRVFTFETSLSDANRQALIIQQKPIIEFNIQEAYLSRLLGEFSRQEPTLNISSKLNGSSENPQLIEFLEGYLLQTIFDSNRDNLQYDVLSDTLSGGFGAVKIVDQYATPESFEIVSRIERFYDPTLCVFDKMARESHKGDGKYSAELFPMLREDFKKKYGSDAAESSDSAAIEGFNWSFRDNSGEGIVLVADYYEKKSKTVKMVKVAASIDEPEQVMTEKDYEIFAAEWAVSRIEQVPVVVASKKAEIETIDRYVISGGSILDHVSTQWRLLPHVFFDGNSKILRRATQGSSYQLTRPFLYHAQGTQQLKNFAGQALANELENMVQHKFLVCIESLLDQYSEAYKNVQNPSMLIYSAYSQDNPDKQLPAPVAAPRTPIPPELAQTFMICDQTLQTIVGSYDGALGINDNQLSGRAIESAAMQSNPVSIPFLVNYMKGWSQVGNILLERMKLNMTAAQDITLKSGQKVRLNDRARGGLSMNYAPHDLQVNIEPGVSFETQRARAFQTIISLMQTVPEFSDFMNNSGSGLPTILENIDIRGIDKLRASVQEYMQMKQQQQQQAQQMQQQQQQQEMQMQQQQLQIMMKPVELKEQEIQLKAQKDAAEVQVKQDQVAINYMKAEAEIENQGLENALRASEIEARNIRSEVDLERSDRDHHHKKAMDLLGLHHAREQLAKNLGDMDET